MRMWNQRCVDSRWIGVKGYMNPYSHIVIASKVEQQVAPVNASEYYWGAIAPDIRYLAGIPRHQTHISHQAIVVLIAQYPHLKSFLQGYLVHCLSDEIPLGEIFYQHLPFSILGCLPRE